ncbi:MAG TPA: pyridoxal-dependent decarboxylase [Longimicrobiaceae bacterium]|jgi:L-2,4-diaminobutyrate decarboxylase|nr:pyridoxal-dependent decarboxylase [Longimicrobiaceae bacterium]
MSRSSHTRATDLPTLDDNAGVLREHGHALIDRMADYLATVETRAASTRLGPAEIARLFAEPLPVDGMPAEAVWDDVWQKVVGDAIHLAHPMYMGHQVAPPLPHAVLADAMTSLLNQSVAVWEMSPTGTLVEAQVVRWLGQLLGFPATADGTLVSGGSVANLTGLLAAREARFPGCWKDGVASGDAQRAVLLVSGHSHYSVDRTAGLMGLGSDAVVPVPDRGGKMDPQALADTIAALRREGRIPLAVSATAASTATGLFDPIDEVADVCAREGVWLHVDAAHGGSFLLSDALRHRLRGVERADSVAWDPHKMMWMPMSTGAVFVRDRRHLDETFQQSAPYLFHVRDGEERSRDAGKRTLQCSRRFDALKLWVCLRHYGTRHFAALLEKTVATTEALHTRLAAAPDFEPMHAVESNILCFRHLPAAVRDRSDDAVDTFQNAVRERYNASGRGWITATVLDGRRVLRVTLINPQTGEEHLERMMNGLREIGAEVAGVPGG